MAKSLYRVAQDDLPWPDDDPDQPDRQLKNKSKDGTPESSKESDNRRPLNDCTTIQGNTDPSPSHRRTNLSNFFKAYQNEKDRYRGTTVDNFDRKFAVFNEFCDQAEINDEWVTKIFFIILCGAAGQFYFD